MATTITNTVLGSPLGSGTVSQDASTADVGLCVLAQSKTISKSTTGTVTFSSIVYLPPYSQIVDIIIDPLVAWDSGTSAGLTVGTAAAGTQYASSTDMKTASARSSPTFTLAQLAAMVSVGTTTTVYITMAQVGTTTAGSCQVTILYVQNPV